jgi:AraC-like DNA-binding protein
MDPSLYLVFPESVGRYNDFPDHRMDRPAATFPYFNLHYVVSGEGYVEDDGKWRLLHAGDAFLYFPDRSQQYRSSEENPWDIYWMHFYGDRLEEILTERGFRSSVVWSSKTADLLCENIQKLFHEIENTKLMRPSVLSMLAYGVLTEFMTQAVPHHSRRARDSARSVTELLPSMQDAACEPFSLEAWAAKAEISTYYFCKSFRKATQMTPMEFITLYRIRHAKQMLLDDPNRPVHLVSEACGYPSVSYFIKRFKQLEGMTPSAYRGLYS